MVGGLAASQQILALVVGAAVLCIAAGFLLSLVPIRAADAVAASIASRTPHRACTDHGRAEPVWPRCLPRLRSVPIGGWVKAFRAAGAPRTAGLRAPFVQHVIDTLGAASGRCNIIPGAKSARVTLRGADALPGVDLGSRGQLEPALFVPGAANAQPYRGDGACHLRAQGATAAVIELDGIAAPGAVSRAKIAEGEEQRLAAAGRG